MKKHQGYESQDSNGKFVTKDLKEKIQHGDKQFRMSVYKTYVPSFSNLVLYSHWNEELEFLIIEEGSAQFYIGQEKIKISSGDVLIIPPNMLHSASRVDQGEIVFYAVLVHYNFLSSFENDIIQSKYVSSLFLQQRQYPSVIPKDKDSQMGLFSVLKEIIHVYWNKPAGYELKIKAMLFDILFRLEVCAKDIDTGMGRARGSHHSLLAIKLLAFIQENYSKRISLNDMANQVNMNPSYFCRFVKKQFDLTPLELLNQHRLLEAVNLLETSDKKVVEISNLTGFSNVNRFTETFKKAYGYTPTHYRNNILDCSCKYLGGTC
ncbi:AraC family transcriptional regulator [Paenibacillus silvae]|jgi:AraC-like DNA-binding protein/quercetin dioxygenase-like cupin family protein|uniref:helix-turn-helix domain-containing protein n=1 Tax=Paenibacillus silvae TaxID=1325358 RepID=UPI003CF3FBB0